MDLEAKPAAQRCTARRISLQKNGSPARSSRRAVRPSRRPAEAVVSACTSCCTCATELQRSEAPPRRVGARTPAPGAATCRVPAEEAWARVGVPCATARARDDARRASARAQAVGRAAACRRRRLDAVYARRSSPQVLVSQCARHAGRRFSRCSRAPASRCCWPCARSCCPQGPCAAGVCERRRQMQCGGRRTARATSIFRPVAVGERPRAAAACATRTQRAALAHQIPPQHGTVVRQPAFEPRPPRNGSTRSMREQIP